MEQTGPSLTRRVVAGLVLVAAAYVLFKLVIGFVTAIAGTIAVLVAIVAIVWALRVL